MIGGWGWRWGWGMLAAAGGTAFEDAFWTDELTGEALADHAPDTDNSGNGWTENLGSWTVGYELGYVAVSEDTAVHAATCSVSLANCTIQVKATYSTNTADHQIGLLVRGDSDISNYWLVVLDPSDSLLKIVKCESGQVPSTEASTAITGDFQDNTQYTVKAVCSDARITAYCILGETEDSVYNEEEWMNTETRHGMYGYHRVAEDLMQFDDFTIEVS